MKGEHKPREIKRNVRPRVELNGARLLLAYLIYVREHCLVFFLSCIRQFSRFCRSLFFLIQIPSVAFTQLDLKLLHFVRSMLSLC